MRGLTIVKSLLVRLCLIAHGLVGAWRVIDTFENQYSWVILVGIGFLLVETGVVIWLRNGREFKIVAFCIIFYLACAIPSLCLIHIDTANRKLFHLAEIKLNARATGLPLYLRQRNLLSNATATTNSSTLSIPILPSTTPPITVSIGILECNDKAWYHMDEQRWLDAIEETMLLVLAITRILISREHMTMPKSGIVLLVTLINGVDILALSHSLQYHDVMVERLLMYIGLTLMAVGLFQMAFIDTDGLTSVSRDHSSKDDNKKKLSKRIHLLQDQNICPLFRSLFIHDGLYLFFRVLLAARVRCSKPTIIFFMGKNVLMMVLHCYRVYYMAKERDKKRTWAAYESLINAATLRSPKKYRHPFYKIEQDQQRRKNKRNEQRLLHRTLHRSTSIEHRRAAKSPRTTLPTFSTDSVSYPFARRRNDGGGARTAFALYGLPFHTSQAARPATVSSCSSVLAKAFAH